MTATKGGRNGICGLNQPEAAAMSKLYTTEVASSVIKRKLVRIQLGSILTNCHVDSASTYVYRLQQIMAHHCTKSVD